MEKTRENQLLPTFVAELLLLAMVAAGLLTFFAIWSGEDAVEQPPVAELPPPRPPSPRTVFPDLGLAVTVGERKRVFLDFIQDYVDEQNRLITLDRLRLLAVGETLRNGGALAAASRDWLSDLAARYEVAAGEFDGNRAWLDELLFRVDIVPASLALAQAANESAWGTSRFAREGNNVFGQWCFEPGCGIVPRQRRSGATHEVRSFATLRDAVEAYFLNINTNASYQFFRELRQAMKSQQRELDSLVLAFGLNHYSERGRDYVDELQTIIVQNDLAARDMGYVFPE